NAGARIDCPRLKLDLGCKRIVLDFAIPLEGDPADYLTLHQDDDDGRPFAPDAHVLKKAGGKERLQRFVDFGGIVSIAGREGEIGADRLGLHSLITLDTYVLNDALGIGRGFPKALAKAQRERDATQHNEGREQPSSQRPPHHYWCLPLKADPRRRSGFRLEVGHCFVADFWFWPPSTGGADGPPPNATLRVPILQKFQMNQVIPGCKNHQHQHESEPNPETNFLGVLA